MTLWVRIDANIGENPKVWELADRLSGLRGVSAESPRRENGVRAETCVGLLVILFGKVAAHAPSGDVADVSDALLERWAGWAGEPGAFAAAFRDLFVTDGHIDGWAERQGKLVERAERERERWQRRKSAPNSAETPRSDAGVSAEESAARNGTVRITTPLPPEGAARPNGKRPRPADKPAPSDDERAVLDHYRAVHPRRRPGDKETAAVRRALGWGYTVPELCEAIDGNAADEWHRERGKHELEYVLRNNGKIDDFRARVEVSRGVPAIDPVTGLPNADGLRALAAVR
jgi:hypothetical protein